jgi:cytochrome c oxidase subunit 1
MQKVLKLGLVRGLIAFFGTLAVSYWIVIGLGVALNGKGDANAAWFVAGLLATFAFMYGVGAITDWLKWARGISTPEHPHEEPTWERYFNFSLDHKVIGIQYGVASVIAFLFGGLFALIFRTHLVEPELELIGLDFFNTMVGLHGMVVIVGMLLGVGATINYLVPLMIGAKDMAFPRMNGFAFWIGVPGLLLLLMTLFIGSYAQGTGGFDSGWTGYPPLSSNVTKVGFTTFFLGVYIAGFSSIFGGLNVIVTVFRMRAKGMGLFKMPIFVWAALATALIQFTATQMIGLAFQMVLFQRLFGMVFFDAAAGGNPVLFQHLFWFYSHPVVYVFVLPGLGIISELLPVFTRKPLFGYKWIAMSSLGIALVGFFVWAHHMFTSGMNEYLRVPFMYSTLLVAIPTGVKFFSWVGTMWKGKMIFPTPMLFVMGSITIFLLGGISGPINGTVATDLYLHDTYFIVGHFHATMFGGFVFPFFAAIYYWWPKMTGKNYNEFLGKLHFWIMFPAFYLQSVSQMLAGLGGMRRRIGWYDEALGVDFFHLMITIAGYLIGISVIIFLINAVRSIRGSDVAVANPWRSRSPEFFLPSPIPQHNFDEEFEVIGEPYDYGLKGAYYTTLDAAPAATD